MNAVITPTGNSAGEMTILATRSQMIYNEAPLNSDSGNTWR